MNNKSIWLYIAVVLALFVVILQFQLQPDRSSSRESMSAFLDQAEDLSNSMNERVDSGELSPYQATIEIDKSAPPPTRAMQELMAGAMQENIQLSNAYMGELENAEWELILEPGRLAADPDLAESYAMFETVRPLVAKYEELSIRVIDNMHQRIDGLDVSERQKTAFRDGFDASRSQTEAIIRRQWNFERETYNEFEKIIDLLAANQGDWEVVESELLFYEQEPLDQYNLHLQNIDDLADQLRQFQADNIAQARQQLN
jgi:hypothetical protein